MRVRRRNTLHETVELNITAFLNLMVVLVPFLLITAVFSRMTVLELTLPPLGDGSASEETLDLDLQVWLFPDFLEIRDATVGRLQRFEIEGEDVDWPAVSDTLLQIKARFPDEQAITLLVDRAVSYRQLIAVMDHLRVAQVVNQGTLEEYELFPEISIGDAPQAPEAVEKAVPLEALERIAEPAGGARED